MQVPPPAKKIRLNEEKSSLDSSSVAVQAMKSSKPPTWSSSYPPHGQGIFTFNVLRRTPFEITVRSQSSGSADCITLAVQQDSVQFFLGGDKRELLAEKAGDGVGLSPDEVTSYWLSFDRDNLVVKYGKGYFMEETTLLSHSFLAGMDVREQDKKRCAMKNLFGPQVTKVIEFHDFLPKQKLHTTQVEYHQAANSLKDIESNPAGSDTNTPQVEEVADISDKVEFYPQPLIVNWPFAVSDSSTATLFELDKNECTFTASLPPECQELYTNISSANISLDWTTNDQDSRYKFSDAIRYSLETEGKILNTKLRSKRMKYIRVTVGPSHATSPGIPYVLELWPRNEGSPVHSHGNTYGIIKVLHGGVRVEIFNKDMKTLIKHFDVREGDVTWMSPHWYQSHRLFNDTSDFCATLQCYRYGMADQRMWPYFDYVSEDGSRGEFFPNSDFTFSGLHRALLEEYSTHMQNSAGT